MPQPTTPLGSLACVIYLLSLYAFAMLELGPPEHGGLHRLSSLWGLGLLAVPLVLLFLVECKTEKRLRRQAVAWARVTCICGLSGLAGFVLRAVYPSLEARWPTHAAEDPFYQFAPWSSFWNMGAWALIGLGLVGVLVHRATSIRGTNPKLGAPADTPDFSGTPLNDDLTP